MIVHLVLEGTPSFPHESNHTDVVDDITDWAVSDVSIVALRSFDLGVAREISSAGVVRGNATAKVFSGVKQLRSSSPILLQALVDGKRYDSATLELRKTSSTVLATYRFTGVVLGGVGWSGVTGAAVASDRIAFAYEGLTLKVDEVEGVLA